MSGIYLMAGITIITCVAVIGGIIYSKSKKKDVKNIISAFAISIVMFFVAYYLFRLPLDHVLQRLLRTDSSLYRALTTIYAPLTEELAKFFVALLPFIFIHLRRKNVHLFAFAIGLGFGVGEIIFLAHEFAQVPAIAALPWYSLSGFLYERFIVCFLHGAFVYVSLYYVVKRKYRGLPYAMLLHWILNIPIFFAAIFGSMNQIWSIVLSFWTLVILFVMLYVTTKLLYGTSRIGYFLIGQARCPACGKVYDRSVFGLNLGTKRFERCQHCKEWHWLSAKEHDIKNGES